MKRLPVLLLLAVPLAALAGCGDASAPRTVVLISLDTLRPDRLGVYGGAPDVSPTLDALAREATVFDQALAPAPWTLPSHMSLLTGLDPVAHGVRTAADHLSSRVRTLAERLQAQGFRSAAFTDGGFVGKGWGFERGFEPFDAERDDSGGPNGFARILPKALPWLRAQDGESVFLFLHTFDVHSPYSTCDTGIRQEFRQRPTPDGDDDFRLFRTRFTYLAKRMGLEQYGRLSEVLNDYDAGIREADRGVAAVVDELKRLGRWDDALVIVLSDHGEAFYDHGFWIGHGLRLMDNEIRVPLIVKFPHGEGAGTRVDRLVDLLDVAPTALEHAGAAPDALLQGSSLLRLLRSGERSRSYVFGGTSNTERYFLVRDGYKYISPIGIRPMMVFRAHLQPFTPPTMLAICKGWTLPATDEDGKPLELSYDDNADVLGLRDGMPRDAELFDRAADPDELHDLAAQDPQRVFRMNGELLRIYQNSLSVCESLADGQSRHELSEHEVAQLAQLGYLSLEGSHAGAGPANPVYEPFTPPDMTVLDECDRVVHRARLAAAKGGAAPAEFGAEALEAIQKRYVAWAREHPEFALRALWRVLELGEVGAALKLDADAARHGWEIQQIRKDYAAKNPPQPPADAPTPPRQDGK